MNKIIKTNPLKPNNRIIRHACDILKSGGLVILPTETVYGIACDPENNTAMNRLQETKGRDPNKPISRLASSINQVKELCINWNDMLEKLCTYYWPGPLTLVLETYKGWVGFRVPNHQVPLALCDQFEGLLALTSANFSGDSDSITADEAASISADIIIDGGLSSNKALPSSVIKIHNNYIECLREGSIPFIEIQKYYQSGINQ